jgi:HK97 family phage major capsid protein
MARIINPAIGPRNEDERNKLNKLIDVKNAYSSTDPASAGFLIPEESRSTILQTALESSVVRSRATVITMTSSNLKIPFVDSTSNASSVYGGMVFYWTEESAAITATEASFGRVTLDAKKLTGGARIPNELWNDAPALQAWVDAAVPSGLAFYEDDAFFAGSGVGMPLGFFESPAIIAVSRQTASKIDTIDIYNMYARMIPQSLNNAVWICSPACLPELLGLTHDVYNVAGAETVGGGGAGIVQVGNVSGAPTMAILGRPLIVSEKCQALNTAGDINFVDLSHYLIGDRQAISLDASPHSRFMNDETELRVIERVDGRPWIQSAITTKRGSNTLSPFIQLAAG